MTYECKICKSYNGNKIGFGTHLRAKHNMRFREYEMIHIEGKEAPVCASEMCNNKPSYNKTKKDFNKYCTEHANEARAVWAKENKEKLFGGNASWKKGLTKYDHEGIMSQSKKVSGNNNPWHSLSKEERQIAIDKARESRKISESEFVRRNREFEKNLNQRIITSYKDYRKRSGYVEVECLECNQNFNRTYGNMIQYRGGCPHCNHISGSSQAERGLAEFIKTLDPEVQTNIRGIIPPQELDIYSESHKIAVEFNGLYWHSELYKDKKYHRNKTDECRDIGIRLIHVWEDDWRDKEEIVKSMITHAFGKTKNKIHARKCYIKEVCKKERQDFFNANHLHGDVGVKTAFGLYFNDELISCASFRIPQRYEKSIELARYATKLNCVVIGGFSKLSAYVQKKFMNQYDCLITYIDLDNGYFDDNVYNKAGFEYVKDTVLDYHYTDSIIREHRSKYRAASNLTEAQIAENNGVVKIYGTGNRLYKKML